MMFDFISKSSVFFMISGILILISAIALGVLGLKPGIDFSSGSITTLSFEQPVDQGDLKQ